jgi:predicted Zn finger-like uncharacterized protein
MIIVCPSCQARYKFDESRMGDKPKAKTRCTKCGGTIEIENPLMGAMTLPPGNMSPLPPTPGASAISAPPTPPPPPEPEPEPEPPPALTTQQSLNAQPPAVGEPGGGHTITGKDLHKMGVLELPKDKRFSLAVIQGAATGQIFQITKTRSTIGRSGADINIDDPEASRQHAAVEIIGETAILRDLGSTNGTFVELERIEQHVLGNQQEFRIGGHVLMLIVTDVE